MFLIVVQCIVGVYKRQADCVSKLNEKRKHFNWIWNPFFKHVELLKKLVRKIGLCIYCEPFGSEQTKVLHFSLKDSSCIPDRWLYYQGI